MERNAARFAIKSAPITPFQLPPQVVTKTRLASKFAPTTLISTEMSATKLALRYAPITPFQPLLLPLQAAVNKTRPVLPSVSTVRLTFMETATKHATKNAPITQFLLQAMILLSSPTAHTTKYAEIERGATKTATGATGTHRAAVAVLARENSTRSRFPERESAMLLLMLSSMLPYSTATLPITKDAIVLFSKTALTQLLSSFLP